MSVEASAKKRNRPSSKLKGTITVHGDLLAPVVSSEGWATFEERTLHQFSGEGTAFE